MMRGLLTAAAAATVLVVGHGCGGESTAADASVGADASVDTACLGENAWYNDNSEGVVQKVAQKQANAFGLHDMVGNVAEWVSDCYHETYAGAPVDGTSWDEATCGYRVIRGGGFGNTARAVRLSTREGVTPTFYGASVPGVRCVRAAGSAPDAGVVSLEWVTVPTGGYTMGCSTGDSNCSANESPAHAISGLASFQMTKTEVTEQQYYDQTGLDPCKGCVTACATCAASYISWDNAKAFCEAVGARLPTEAEWEYAARAGATGPYLSCE